ncbi:MAG TPA: hypothetical protein VG319_08035, partial [Polyangia bacterium]|nr:hypothetical protein [Polyangia bacterium]
PLQTAEPPLQTAEPPLQTAEPPLQTAEPVPAAVPPRAAAPASATILVEPLGPARAPSGGAPLVAGVLTAFVPFVVGCALWSQSDRTDLETAGTVIMAAGFAAAPWVSHGLQRRWRRATVFGAVSAATSAATLIVMEATDPFYAPHLNRQRVAFGTLLTSAMFASAIGVFDSFFSSPTRSTP